MDDSFIKGVTLEQSHLCKGLLSSVTNKSTIWPQVLLSCHIKLRLLLLAITDKYTRTAKSGDGHHKLQQAVAGVICHLFRALLGHGFGFVWAFRTYLCLDLTFSSSSWAYCVVSPQSSMIQHLAALCCIYSLCKKQGQQVRRWCWVSLSLWAVPSCLLGFPIAESWLEGFCLAPGGKDLLTSMLAN